MDSLDPLHASFLAMHEILEEEDPIEVLLERTVQLALLAVEGCDLASVTLMEDAGPRSPVWSEQAVLDMDEAQYRSGLGPCLSAIDEGAITEITSMVDDQRWPEFAADALRNGVCCSYGVPLIVQGKAKGALNLFARRGSFSDQDHEVAQNLAAQATVALRNAMAFEKAQALAGQLRTGLASRDMIGQAKGILMAQRRITAEQAFTLLVEASQRRNHKLRDVAEEVTRTGCLD